MTVDLECFSFEHNSYDYKNIPKRMLDEALPPLLDLFERYKVISTFFITGRFAELCPAGVKLISSKGHEIGCHGYRHEEGDMLDKSSKHEQHESINKAKSILENLIKKKVESFRSPALRLNGDTIKVLENLGFNYDSSISSQRFDGPFTSGARKKLRWLTAPRKPYYLNRKDPYKKGKSNILEIPISSAFWPLVGTHLRISPTITRFFYRLLEIESRYTSKPIVFLFHPNEGLKFKKGKTKRRGSYLSDVVRHNIKMKNLGEDFFRLLEDFLKLADRKNTRYLTIQEYGNNFNT
jgi:peptidoglycan/xylan/chitin deacetylase (PgdA/CDA1 family)